MNNIIENNKLIARFMYDNLYNEDSLEDCWVETNEGYVNFYIDEAKYHLSWDWLITVVEKINEIDGHSLITLWDKYNIDRFNLTDALDKCIKHEVYDLCVMYIKWYNETFQIQQ